MSVVGGPELTASVTSNPFGLCAVPPVLFGTGELYVVDPDTGVEVDAGNFTAVNLNEEAEGFRFFAPSADDPSAGGVTSAWRLSLVGDYYRLDHVAKIVNSERVPYVGGEVVSLGTVRRLQAYDVVFRRELAEGDPCDPQTCSRLELELWAAFFDVGARVGMTTAQPVAWNFDLVALPAYGTHPTAPFGVLREVCPAPGLS